MRLILVIAVAARVMLIPAPLLTSNDVERYLWDGAVALAGHDPYTTAANSPLVAGLRDIWPTPIEHEQYATLYPPGALLLFATSALAGPTLGLFVWKMLVTAASIAALGLMHNILKSRNLMHHFPLFALSPLLIFEGGVGAHIDIFCVLAIVGAIACLDRSRPLMAGAILGIGASIKFLPLLLLGPLFLALWRKGAFCLVVGTTLSVGIIYGTALLLGYHPVGILPVFFEKWRFGSPLYSLLEITLPPHFLIPAQGGIAIFTLSLATIAALKNHLTIAMTITLATPLLLSPVVFPWYLMVLIPMLALRPTITLLTWTTIAPLGYLVLNRWVSEQI